MGCIGVLEGDRPVGGKSSMEDLPLQLGGAVA